MQTLVMYGDAFGADKMVPITSKHNHLVTSFGLKMMGPVFDLMQQLIDARDTAHHRFEIVALTGRVGAALQGAQIQPGDAAHAVGGAVNDAAVGAAGKGGLFTAKADDAAEERWCSMDKKFAIFDMDGTLIDSMVYWQRLASEYLFSRGVTPAQIPADLPERIKTVTVTGAAALFIELFGEVM